MRSPTETTDESDLDYFAAIRRDLIAPLSGWGLDVLEVGCGTGATGAELLRTGKARRVVGVELDARAATRARRQLDEVHLADIESDELVGLGRFDAVVFGDILEHLVDPWTTLARLVDDNLVEDGTVVASVPNARCYAFWLPLLIGGRFDYRDSGLLDRTHLRWFTKATTIELFASAGLTSRVEGINRVAARRGSMAQAAARILGPFGVVQYLVSGVKRAPRSS